MKYWVPTHFSRFLLLSVQIRSRSSFNYSILLNDIVGLIGNNQNEVKQPI
jgi:hypothetical protein